MTEILTRLDPQAATAPPPGAVAIQIGPVALQVRSAPLDRFCRITHYRWPAHNLVGRRPILQHTGPGTDTLTLSGVIFPAFAGGPSSVEALRTLARSGQPQRLSDGFGAHHGRWAVTRIQEERSVLFADGAPRKIEYRVELAHAGEDEPQGRLHDLEKKTL